MRVPDYLAEQQVRFETLLHAPAFSAQQRAKVLHVSGRQVAKCVLLAGRRNYLLAVLPATHHIDEIRLERELASPVRLANDREIARVFPDCEWGVVPPFGTLYGLATLLDDSLKPDDMLIFEGNTHVEAVRVRCADFERIEKPRRIRFAIER
ncbi:MAG TPA: YbaK/EbsC family protein [Gemmataceae bacterium]|nr:YbaK/EbsC family protein [Gemmataceae bacterium]